MIDRSGEITMEESEREDQRIHIKKDILDYDSELLRHGKDSVYTAGISSLAMQSGNFIPLIYTLYHLGESVRQQYLREKTKEKTKTIDPELGYSAAQLVYKGQEALDLNGFSLREGDDFVYITLPRFNSVGTNSESSLEAMIDATDLSIRQIRDFFKDRDYQAVCIGFQTPKLSTRFPQEHVGSLKSLVARKNVESRTPQSEILAFTREEFEHLCTVPQEDFRKACDALEDPEFSTLLSTVKTASTQEESKNYEKLLLERLNRILKREIDMHFDGSEMVFSREGPNYVPQRKKISRYTYLKKTMEDFYYVNVTSSSGETKMVPLENLLKTRNQSVEDIIASLTLYKKAQLAFVVHQMIKDYSASTLIKEKDLDKREVVERLKKLGIVPSAQGPYDITGVVKSAKFGSRKFYSEVASGLKSESLVIARTALTGILLTVSTNIGLSALSSGGIEGLYDALAKQPTPVTQNIDRPMFPSELPKHGLDWQVQAGEGVDTSGYYIQNTARVFRDGKWQINHNRAKKVELPESLPQTTDSIFLLKGVRLNLLGSTSFKIPIKDHSTVGALRLTGPNNEQVNYSVWMHDDGTVEVEISGDATRNISYVNLIETLVPSESGQVHAVGRITPVTDYNKLSERARMVIQHAGVTPVKDLIPENIAVDLRASHNYSLNPSGKDQVDQALSPEEYADAIFEVSGCNCDVCNTALGVLTSADPNGKPFNMAFGYLNTANGPESSNLGYLRQERAHAFGIKEDGRIVDATPSDLADDQMTQQYAQLLSTPGEDSSENQEWQDEFNDLAKDQDIINKVKALIAIGGVTSSFYIAGKLSRVLRRIHPRETTSSLIDKSVLSIFTQNDLKKVFNFLTWLSFGKPGQLNLDAEMNYEDKEQILRALRQNVNYAKLDEYSRNAVKYDGIVSLDEPIRLKVRLLAKYLLS